MPQSMKFVTFDSPYGGLPKSNKTGFTFLGWFNEINERVTEDSIISIPNNHTFHVHWLEFSPGQVEVVLNTGGMTQERVEKIVKQYIDAEFVIALIETNMDEIRVIAEFADAEVAQEFVRNVYDAHRLGEGGD